MALNLTAITNPTDSIENNTNSNQHEDAPLMHEVKPLSTFACFSTSIYSASSTSYSTSCNGISHGQDLHDTVHQNETSQISADEEEGNEDTVLVEMMDASLSSPLSMDSSSTSFCVNSVATTNIYVNSAGTNNTDGEEEIMDEMNLTPLSPLPVAYRTAAATRVAVPLSSYTTVTEQKEKDYNPLEEELPSQLQTHAQFQSMRQVYFLHHGLQLHIRAPKEEKEHKIEEAQTKNGSPRLPDSPLTPSSYSPRSTKITNISSNENNSNGLHTVEIQVPDLITTPSISHYMVRKESEALSPAPFLGEMSMHQQNNNNNNNKYHRHHYGDYSPHNFSHYRHQALRHRSD